MSKIKSKLSTFDLNKVMIAFKKIDEVTDDLDAQYGDDWGEEVDVLGNVWSELYDLIEYHVGVNKVYPSIGLFEVDDEK